MDDANRSALNRMTQWKLVYDAAMEWLEEVEFDMAEIGNFEEDCLYPCEKKLLDACRKAKEVN